MTTYPRQNQPLRDAVSALREECALEALVLVVGTDKAQQAAYRHNLPQLLEDITERRPS